MNLFVILIIFCGVLNVWGELACYSCDKNENSCDNVTALYMEVGLDLMYLAFEQIKKISLIHSVMSRSCRSTEKYQH